MGSSKLVRGILSHRKKQVVRFIFFKTYLFETVAILRKRKLYSNIKWTSEQQKEFDDFWLVNYGRTIPNWWHKLYQNANGIFNIRYMPEMLYSTVIEPKWNPYFQSHVLQNKGLLELLVSSKQSDECRCPKTFVLCDEGIYYDSEHNVVSTEYALMMLNNIGDCVIKPIKDSSSGHDVRILNVNDGQDEKSHKSIESIVKQYGSNYIVQEKIRPSACLAKLYPKSINTFRITTYCFEGNVYHAASALRIGSNGGEVDNIHAGGLGVFIHDDGRLDEKAYRLGYGDSALTYSKHPDTGVEFNGYQINKFDKVLKSAHELHGAIPGVGIISWDFTLDEKDIPVLIEANILGQGSWFPQMISGKGLFGENTEAILRQSRDA